jgi:regulation of enolase protein 1 (concanavalin A-like superfamily)
VGEVTLMGCIHRQDVIVGRGRLRAAQAYLRLERRGDQLRAFCSDNGEEWYTVGQVEFPIDERLEAGLYAIGNIDRMLHHGAFPDGTAIRFSDFSLSTEETI